MPLIAKATTYKDSLVITQTLQADIANSSRFPPEGGRHNGLLLQRFYHGEDPGVNQRHPNFRRSSRVVNLDIPHFAAERRDRKITRLNSSHT